MPHNLKGTESRYKPTFKRNPIRVIRQLPPRIKNTEGPPIIEESDNTPDKIRFAYNINPIKPNSQNVSKVAIITCFATPVIQLNNDVNEWFKIFYPELPPVNINVFNDDLIVIYNENWYTETLLDVCAVLAMNPYAEVGVFCSKTSSTDFSVPVAKAMQNGYTILSLSLGSSERNGTYPWVTSNKDICVFSAAGNFRIPVFPASSNGVFAVGATELLVKDNYTVLEKVAPWSACGPTKFGKVPSYQSRLPQLVNTYSFMTKCAPDFSINGISFPIFDSTINKNTNKPKKWGSIGGTSLATPLVAGIFSIINQYKLNANLGVLTRSEIYTVLERKDATDFFMDKVVGFSKRDMISENPVVPRYSAAPGYDTCSGFGTPNLSKWLDYFVNRQQYPPNPADIIRRPDIITIDKIFSRYNVPIIGPNPNTKKTKIGIITAFINNEQRQNDVRNDLALYCSEYKNNLTFSDLSVNFVSLGQSITSDIAYKNAYEQLSCSLQLILSVNKNADIVVVSAVDTGIVNMSKAVERACQLGCDIVKINYLNPDSNGFLEYTTTERRLDQIFLKYRNVLFIAEVGKSISYPSTSGRVLSVASSTAVLDSDYKIINEVSSTEQGVGPSRLTAKPFYQNKISQLNGFSKKVVPDVCSMGGENLFINMAMGETIYQSGPKVSAAIVTGLLSLVNQGRINKNLKTLTLENMYKIFERNDARKYFFDIVSGSTNSKYQNKNNVFHTAGGYDIATGFGVPNVIQLLNL